MASGVSSWVGPPETAEKVAGLVRDGVPVLLMGPAGTGKRKLARQVAEEVGKPLLVRTHGSGATAEVRELLSSLSVRRPEFRVAVLELSARTHPNLANSLLKVLEEPPAKVGFVLSSSDPVMATIRSRALPVKVSVLPTAQVAAAVLGLTDEELTASGVDGLSHEAAWWAARSAQGRVGTAVELLAARPALPRTKSLVRAAAEADSPAWLAEVAALGTVHDEAMRSRARSEAVSVVQLLRTWTEEILKLGGSALLEATYGLERNFELVRSLWESLSTPTAVRYPALAVRRGMWAAVYR